MSDTYTPTDDIAETPPKADEPAADTGGAFERAAQRVKRSNVRPEGPNPLSEQAPPPKLDDPSQAEALAPGSKFVDPNGVTRIVPYKTTAENFDDDFRQVPEGSQFLDPEGQMRQKPKYESVGYTAQTLYDMALTDKEKRKALERSYPGKVKQDAEGYYVEDEGKFLRPGRGTAAVTGFLTAAAAPTIGAIGGGLTGGAGGAAAGGVGAVPGALAGAGLGGATGQFFNDLVLQVSGVYDRTSSEEATNLLFAGGTSMVGEGAGRLIAGAAPTLREGISKVSEAGPAMARKFLGANKQDLEMAEKLSKEGVPIMPSTVFKESPHLENVIERFYERFHIGYNLDETEKFYERKAGDVLKDLGVERKEGDSIIRPKQAVSSQAAGEAIKTRAIEESALADKTLQETIAARKASVESGKTDVLAQREAILKAAEESRNKAQALIEDGYKRIQDTADTAMKIANAGHNGGDLFKMAGAQFRALRQGIGDRASYFYDRYNEMTGGVQAPIQRLSGEAARVLEQLPEDFQSKYPDIVRKLKGLTGEIDDAGNVVKEPQPMSYGDMQKLRSLFRGNADWSTLSSDFKNGVWKHFSNEVDRVIHDPAAPPQIQASAKYLDMVDRWYGHNISIFNSQQIKAVMKGLESGEPADPQVLRNILFKEGHSDLIKRTMSMLGPSLAGGVRAADVDAMLMASRSVRPGVIDGKAFVREVLDREKSGLLQAVHGNDVRAGMLKQAEYIEMLDGRLPIAVKDGDTMADVIAKAKYAAEEAKKIANKDPLGALKQEMKKVQSDEVRMTNEIKRRKNDPLNFVYNETTGAAEVANKILSNEDLILTAGARFGENSPEFNMLRQVYTQRLFEGGKIAEKLPKISDQIQRLMFGASYEDAKTLAKEWEFLMGARGFSVADAGTGMMVQSKVEHPVGGKLISTGARIIPGVNTAARGAWASYYAFMRNWISKNPALFTYLMRGLRGSDEEKQAVRVILSKHAQRYGAMAAGGAQAGFQAGEGQSGQEQ